MVQRRLRWCSVGLSGAKISLGGGRVGLDGGRPSWCRISLG